MNSTYLDTPLSVAPRLTSHCSSADQAWSKWFWFILLVAYSEFHCIMTSLAQCIWFASQGTEMRKRNALDETMEHYKALTDIELKELVSCQLLTEFLMAPPCLIFLGCGWLRFLQIGSLTDPVLLYLWRWWQWRWWWYRLRVTCHRRQSAQARPAAGCCQPTPGNICPIYGRAL